jgi:hypothetical protein
MPRVRPDVTGQILLDWIESHADSNGIVEAGAPSLAKALGRLQKRDKV